MGLNARIFTSFSLLGVVVVAISLLGLTGNMASVSSLKEVISQDLPAEKNLGVIARYFEALTSEKNHLLNPNLSSDERDKSHANYKLDRKKFISSMKEFSGFINELPRDGDPEATALAASWVAYQREATNWLSINAEILALFKKWEDTFILNPSLLWGEMQQYRADHYILVRRLAEMVNDGQVIGGAINPADTLCAFGQWRVSFDDGKEIFSKNPAMAKAMSNITEHHRRFHSQASELYNLISENNVLNEDRIASLFNEVAKDADQVVGGFTAMIDEANSSLIIYKTATRISQGALEVAQQSCHHILDQVVSAKTKFDAFDKGRAIEAGESGVTWMKFAMGLAIIMSVGLAIFVGMSLRWMLIGPLNHVIADLNMEAGDLGDISIQLSSTSSALTQGAEEQSVALEKSSAAIEELSSMTNRNADNSQHANVMMGTNSSQVSQGLETIGRMGAAMEAINQSSEEISRIITTIENIAFQTNILALNAAVEAARAGEAGQGFAVVANEVRNLAQRSAQASNDTRALIEDTANRVAVGRDLTKTITDFFAELSVSTVEVGNMIKDINEATTEQALGMSQINQSVAEIDKVAGQSLVNAHSADTASTKLTGLSTNLIEAVQSLELIVGKPSRKSSASSPNEARVFNRLIT